MLEKWLMLKMINLLTIPWKDLDAYKLGIIDADGKQLRTISQLRISEEKVAYGIFHKFCFNLRRLIESLPGGKSKLSKYLTVYALFKEDTDLDSYFTEEFDTLNSYDKSFEDSFSDETL